MPSRCGASSEMAVDGRAIPGLRVREELAIEDNCKMRRALAVAMIILLGASAAEAQKDSATPYWASISAGKPMMRTGLGKNYPATWLYVLADLPIIVVEVYPSWRKIQDPAGTTGWMLVNLLSDTRTALVTGEEPAP